MDENISVTTKSAQFDGQHWISLLPESLHNLPINMLAIPGSHDSCSYSVTKDGDVAPDASQVTKVLINMFGSAAKDIIVKWSITQSYNVPDQLTAGIRYFDLRVAEREVMGNSNFYFVHSLYGCTVIPVLRQIHEFLDSHPKEIVLLDFNHLYNMNDSAHQKFIEILKDVFGSKVCPYLDTESVTLNMMWENNLQVVIFYDNDVVKQHMDLWPGEAIPSPWADTPVASKLMQFLESHYESQRPVDKFYVTQAILTPNACTVITNLNSDLKNALAKKIAPIFIDWVQRKTSGKDGINICILDFVQMQEYIPTIVGLNKK